MNKLSLFWLQQMPSNTSVNMMVHDLVWGKKKVKGRKENDERLYVGEMGMKKMEWHNFGVVFSISDHISQEIKML